MCGIGGWIGQRNADARDRMRDALRHRGPDDDGEYESECATLVHRRLSVIDVQGGHQPIPNEDGRLHIVFNGEIYNYRALRDELLVRGHVFKTQSDTEVILHLYEEMGSRCPERLLGTFAFAIWDERERTLFLARDRMGVKPLFFAPLGKLFLFASELKAILAHGSVRREMDIEGLNHYLTFMYVPAPLTIVKGVQKLPPGSTLTLRDGRIDITRYWQIPRPEDIVKQRPFDAATEELRHLLQESVQCRLMSEVPLGAYLSGGLDSSLIVALMSRASNDLVNTFSVGFEERGYDERSFARRVASEFATNHRELMVGRASASELSEIVRALDEPVADPAAIPTYFMARLTKKHATVVLTGEGADELFAGYPYYRFLAWTDCISGANPSGAMRAFSKLLGSGMLGRGARYVADVRDRSKAYLALKSVFTVEERSELFSSGLSGCALNAPETIVRDYLRPDAGSYLQQLLRFELSTWLPDDLLVKVDRMTMAHAVEARVPYLDHRVVELVMRMPPSWKLGFLSGKRILRHAAAELLPKDVLRRKKTGFAVPVAEWATGEMRDLMMDLLGTATVRRRGLFDPKKVSQVLLQAPCGLYERRQLWTLACLELWCREVLSA